jgi:PTS system trehalose-specific IIC component
MYKINIPSFFPFWNALIASGVGSFLSIISGVTSNSVGIGDFLAILLIQKNSKIEGVQTFPGTGFLWFFIANLVTVIIVLIFNFICYYSFNKIKKFKDKHNKVKLRDY